MRHLTGAEVPDLSGLRHVIPAQRFYFGPKLAAGDGVEQMGESGVAGQIALRKHQIISGLLQGNKIETEDLGGGSDADPGIGLALRDVPCDFEVRADE